MYDIRLDWQPFIHNSSPLGPSMQSSLLPEWLQGYVGFLPSRRGPGKGQKGPQLLLQASTLGVALPYPSLDPHLVLVGGESQWRLRPGPPSGWHLALSLWALESWLGASLLCRKNTGLWEYKSSTLSCQCSNTPQKYLVLIFLFICVCLCTITHTWKSEDNLWKSIFFLPCEAEVVRFTGKGLYLPSHPTNPTVIFRLPFLISH